MARLVAVMLCLSLCCAVAVRHGPKPQGGQAGYCAVDQDDAGVWWLGCPAAGITRSLSLGVNHVENCDLTILPGNDKCDPGSYGSVRYSMKLKRDICPWFCISYDRGLNASAYFNSTIGQYGTSRAWAKAAAGSLSQWRFNTVGSWSSPLLTGANSSAGPTGLLYGLSLDMLLTSYEHRFLPNMGMPVDVFSPAFRAQAEATAERHCKPRATDPYLLGYWTDNEAPFHIGKGSCHKVPNCSFDSVLTGCLLALNGTEAGFAAAIAWLGARYTTVAALNAAWGTHAPSFGALPSQAPFPTSTARTADDKAFLAFYIAHYMNVSATAIRRWDPNHMILGSRLLPGPAAETVAAAEAKYTSVVDIHLYSELPDPHTLTALHAATGNPVLMSEFGFRAQDSGLPNTQGAGPVVTTQAERAAKYKAYVHSLLAHPFVIGYHMFAWTDMPARGQLFGANSNYGLVHLDSDEYSLLTKAFTDINANATAVHAASVRPGAQ